MTSPAQKAAAAELRPSGNLETKKPGGRGLAKVRNRSDTTSRLGTTGAAAGLRPKMLGKARGPPGLNPFETRVCHTAWSETNQDRKAEMPTIFPDVQTMRRRKIHYIMDENDDLAWSGAKMGDALTWLYENGHADFYMKIDDVTFKLTIVRLNT